MNRHFTLLTLALWLTALFSAPPVAIAQESDNELRRQNERLTAELQHIRRQLDQERERNRQLEARIARLEQQLAAAQRPGPVAGTPLPPAEDETITVDESVSSASPRALFAALVRSYEETMEGQPIGREGDRERRAYLRKVEGWRAGVVRDLRSPIVWHVRVVDVRLDREGRRIVTLLAVDPKTDARLGNPFDVVLSQTLAERLARLESRGELGVLVLRGTLHPDVRVNPERDTRGSFDNPPFIGPFAEFLFRIDVTSLQPPREEEKNRKSGDGAKAE